MLWKPILNYTIKTSEDGDEFSIVNANNNKQNANT